MKNDQKIDENRSIISIENVVVPTRRSKQSYNNSSKNRIGKVMNIATVYCGGKGRARYVLPLVKSAILFSETKLNIHLFTDISTGEELKLIVIFLDHR